MALPERRCSSTGYLSAPWLVRSHVRDAHRRSKSNSDTKSPQADLVRVPSELFGVCGVRTRRRIYGAGAVDHEFSIMSMSKPFLLALICETIRPRKARAKLSASATGFPSSEIAPISPVRHVPVNGEPKEKADQGREPMDVIDRRSTLRGILYVAVAAGFSAIPLLNTVDAMPLALEKGLGNEAGDLKVRVQAVASRPSRRPVRPPPRPVPRPRHRRHRRWVCRWHRGRRVCGWRW